MKREGTKYPGVFYYIRKDGEKVYYIRYRTGGKGTKHTEEPVGTTSKGMTEAKAAQIRAARMSGKAASNREARAACKKREDEWTLKKIFFQYMSTLKENKSRGTDRSLFNNWLKTIHDKKPSDITSQDIESVQRNLEKGNRSAQTIKHVLNLITRSMNYALRTGILRQDEVIQFVIKKPKVDANKTENMNDELFSKYIAALDLEEDKERVAILKIALFSGMRKSAVLALRWKHIDFQHGVLELEGKSAKNGQTAFIPLNANLIEIFQQLKQGSPEEFLFPSPVTGGKRQDFRRMAVRVKKNAGLPDDFRPMHGLRHTYASRLASSGQIDLYTLQKLLTHETPEMTQRYAHLSDEAMKRAAAVADSVMTIKKEE